METASCIRHYLKSPMPETSGYRRNRGSRERNQDVRLKTDAVAQQHNECLKYDEYRADTLDRYVICQAEQGLGGLDDFYHSLFLNPKRISAFMWRRKLFYIAGLRGVSARGLNDWISQLGSIEKRIILRNVSSKQKTAHMYVHTECLVQNVAYRSRALPCILRP